MILSTNELELPGGLDLETPSGLDKTPCGLDLKIKASFGKISASGRRGTENWLYADERRSENLLKTCPRRVLVADRSGWDADGGRGLEVADRSRTAIVAEGRLRDSRPVGLEDGRAVPSKGSRVGPSSDSRPVCPEGSRAGPREVEGRGTSTKSCPRAGPDRVILGRFLGGSFSASSRRFRGLQRIGFGGFEDVARDDALTDVARNVALTEVASAASSRSFSTLRIVSGISRRTSATAERRVFAAVECRAAGNASRRAWSIACVFESLYALASLRFWSPTPRTTSGTTERTTSGTMERMASGTVARMSLETSFVFAARAVRSVSAIEARRVVLRSLVDFADAPETEEETACGSTEAIQSAIDKRAASGIVERTASWIVDRTELDTDERTVSETEVRTAEETPCAIASGMVRWSLSVIRAPLSSMVVERCSIVVVMPPTVVLSPSSVGRTGRTVVASALY